MYEQSARLNSKEIFITEIKESPVESNESEASNHRSCSRNHSKQPTTIKSLRDCLKKINEKRIRRIYTKKTKHCTLQGEVNGDEP